MVLLLGFNSNVKSVLKNIREEGTAEMVVSPVRARKKLKKEITDYFKMDGAHRFQLD